MAGSSFVVRLLPEAETQKPRVDRNVLTTKLVELSPERTAGREHSVTPSPLIAADNVTNRLVLGRTLTRWGMRLEVAETGREALAGC
jgi:hypothetical protein